VRVVFAGDAAPPGPADGRDAGALRRGVREVLGDASRRLGVGAGDVVVRFVDEDEIRELNRVWRGKDRPTDVLSFPSGLIDPAGRRHLGDIALCLPVAARQAARRRHTPRREALLLALHGLLHLLGYDHETDGGEMEALERRLRQACLPPRA
jgi:probable rRNA maturation factor